MTFETNQFGEPVAVIYTPYITIKGKRVYRKNGGMFRLEVPASKYRPN